MNDRDVQQIEVTAGAEARYTEHVHDEMTRTVWHDGGCNSWYKNSAGKHTNNWAGFTFSYRNHTRKPDWSAYDLVR